MASRSRGGFNPSRGGRRVAAGGRRQRRRGGVLVRFALAVAAGTALLWLIDRPIAAEKIGAQSVMPPPQVDAG